MRLLLAEDDAMLGASLVQALKEAGYSVAWHKDGESAELAALYEAFDVVVLDIGLPKQSGFEVLAKLRKHHKTLPVLLLTAMDNISARVQGLDSGADDYLPKPFDLDELLARLRAITRRSQGRVENSLQSRDVTYDPVQLRVIKAGKEISLPPKEMKLLALLMRSEGIPVSKLQIEASLYGDDEEVDSNAIEVLIYNLRKKLGQEFIRTKRGIGYMVSA